MNYSNLMAHSAERRPAIADVMLGAGIRVADDARGTSYREGVVVAIEPHGSGECLRVAVHKRVVERREETLPKGSVMVVDTEISVHLVQLTINKGLQ